MTKVNKKAPRGGNLEWEHEKQIRQLNRTLKQGKSQGEITMETIKFVRKPKIEEIPTEGSRLVRVSTDIWCEIGKLSDETGLSRAIIASKLCMFALDHVELVDPQEMKFKE